MSIQSVNPATGDVLETLEETTPAQIDTILARAHAAFTEWRGEPFARRSALMTTPRPTGTSADPPRGRGPAWERPGARPS